MIRVPINARRLTIVWLVLALCLGCGPHQDEQSDSKQKLRAAFVAADATEIVRAAIEAHGGESNFAKASVGQTKMTIDGAFLPGVSGHFTKLDIFDLPAKLKRVVNGRAEHALAEADCRNRRARQIVYGHTHQHEIVPLDASHADGYVLSQTYFNAGTCGAAISPRKPSPATTNWSPMTASAC